MEHNSQISSKIHNNLALVVIIWTIVLEVILPLKAILVLNTILDWVPRTVMETQAWMQESNLGDDARTQNWGLWNKKERRPIKRVSLSWLLSWVTGAHCCWGSVEDLYKTHFGTVSLQDRSLGYIPHTHLPFVRGGPGTINSSVLPCCAFAALGERPWS